MVELGSPQGFICFQILCSLFTMLCVCSRTAAQLSQGLSSAPSCSSPSLPQLNKWHLCSSNCPGKNFDSFLSLPPHILFISMLICESLLWYILSIWLPPVLLTWSKLPLSFLGPQQKPFFLLYFLTCLLQSAHQTTARMIMLKQIKTFQWLPSSLKVKSKGLTMSDQGTTWLVLSPPPQTSISYPMSYHFYTAVLSGDVASLFTEHVNMHLLQGLCIVLSA